MEPTFWLVKSYYALIIKQKPTPILYTHAIVELYPFSDLYEIITGMLEKIISFLQSETRVQALVLSGSRTGLVGDEHSDYDMYLYSTKPLDIGFRQELARQFSKRAEVGNSFFEDGDELLLHDGTALDIMYRSLDWATEEIEQVWIKHRARVGYTTATIHTIKNAQILFDRVGQFSRIQKQVATPYPSELVQSIISKNYPLLRSKLMASYHEQLEKALKRRDMVSQAHRSAALLASYFDILFALNRQTHPGEKQLVKWAVKSCSKLPVDFETDIQHLVSHIGTPALLESVSHLLDHLDALLDEHHIQQ